MPSPHSVFSLVLVSALLVTSPPQAHAAANSAPFALLELFTSEGCSSCPPADRLLTEVAARARSRGERIFTLEFHVDYWNHLGWTDPFSSHEFSVRQNDYARVFNSAQVYTPQLVINGVEQRVGSDRRGVEASIARALTRSSPAALNFKVTHEGGAYHVAYRASAVPAGALLCVALTDSSAVTRVGAGENSGATLAHTNVVRQFVTTPLDGRLDGVITLRNAKTKQAPGTRLIAFVQDAQSLAVLAAGVEP